MKNTGNLSRRTFLGAGALTAGVAALGLAGCAPKESGALSDTGEGAADSTAVKPEHRWQSEAAAAWRTPPTPVPDDQIADGGTFDVVIVGGGQAGTWTAKSCARNGLSTAVIESQPEDNHQYVGGEVGTVNNPFALEHGAIEIDEQEFMRELFHRNASRSNQRMLRDYIKHSGELLQREVIDEMDADWIAGHTHMTNCPPDPRMVMDPSGYKFFLGTVIFRSPDMPATEWAWNDVMHHQMDASKEFGAVWLHGTHADYLEKDDSGRASAVIARNVETGEYQRLTATKAVVLAGGDFSGNVDMLRDINDEYRHLAESYGDIEAATSAPVMLDRDGSGLAMGVWAGGHVEVGPHAAMNTGMTGPAAPWGPGAPLLNQAGLRFCDECAGGAEGFGYMASRQPRGVIASFSDQNWQDVVYTMPPAHMAVEYNHEVTWPARVSTMEAVVPGSEPSIVESNFPIEVYCADTLEELVSVMGCWSEEEQQVAVAELKRYQQMAADGVDDDFAKDPRILAVTKLDTPPYYACFSTNEQLNAGLTQTTGLDVDADHHVLDTQCRPIPGLFAVGNNAGNRFIVQYATPLSGMSLGYCLTEGILLGERLASGEIS